MSDEDFAVVLAYREELRALRETDGLIHRRQVRALAGHTKAQPLWAGPTCRLRDHLLDRSRFIGAPFPSTWSLKGLAA